MKGEAQLEGLRATDILPSAPRGAGFEAHLKCFCTNTLRVRDKQEELEALAQSQSYYIIDVSKTWWEESSVWCAVVGGYKLFRKHRQGTKKVVGMAES